MALKGNLHDFTITQLFNLVNLAGKTGMLVIETKAHNAQVFFKDGKLVQSHLDQDGQNNDLVTILLKAGKINADQAKLVRQRAATRTDKELALLLIGAGYSNQRDIVQAVKDRILESVYPLFAWTEGSFYFDSNQISPDEQITVMLNLENVIIEGTRRIKEWGQLKDDLPGLDWAVRFVDKPDVHLRNVQLTVEEWRVISFVSPKNTLRQIAAACKMDDLQLRKTVYRLLQAGLIEVMRPTAKPPILTPSPVMATGPSQPFVTPPPPKVDRGLLNRLIQKIKSIGE